MNVINSDFITRFTATLTVKLITQLILRLKKLTQCNDSAIKAIFFTVVVISISACSSLGVEPWQRDLLATKAMALTSSPIDTALDEHIYFSKEASSGGKGFGGGGCGCN